jgi:hypothetical protein
VPLTSLNFSKHCFRWQGQEYDNVWRALLQDKQLPFTPAPDLDEMWGYYKIGGMDEQALLDQACEVLGKFPCRLDPKEWKGKTYSHLMSLAKQRSRYWLESSRIRSFFSYILGV